MNYIVLTSETGKLKIASGTSIGGYDRLAVVSTLVITERFYYSAVIGRFL